MRSFMDLAASEKDQISTLLERASALRSGDRSELARGRTLGLLLLNPSLRTRVSMVAAWSLLGGDCVDLSPGQGMWNLASGSEPMLGDEAEHIEEAAGVLGRLCDVLAVRAFAAGKNWEHDRQDSLINAFLEHGTCPFVNMESALYHPCQALADWLTLNDHEVPEHEHFVLSWAWHPKALPMAVPNSALLMAAQRGMRVTVLRPDGYSLDPDIMERAQTLAAGSGGSLEESNDPATLKDAKVVYAKSWGSIEAYGDPTSESKLRADYRDWCVGSGPLKLADSTKFMHCLPVRRDVVASTEVLKSERSLILDQAENRKWAQAAVLEAMARRWVG